jgi:hypothetical protein
MTLVEDLRRVADAVPTFAPKLNAAADRIEELERQVESLKEALDLAHRREDKPLHALRRLS